MTMRSKRVFLARLLLAAAFQLSVPGGEAGDLRSSGANGASLAAPPRTNVRTIILPHFEPDLPAAPGRDEFSVVCVSCHSARYVMMQPLFPRRQWEETVDKMAKVYGALMDEKQRQSIIGYLAAIHGPDATLAGSVSDEDADPTPANKPAPRPDTAPLLEPAGSAPEQVKAVKRGADLFEQDCAGCHGTTGRGDGWASQVFWRKPKDLAAMRFSLRALSQVLWQGKRGTAMPSWRGLPQQELVALAAYVQSLRPPIMEPASSVAELQQGNQVFLRNCAPCHGVAGDGKGPAAANLTPEPANFRAKQPDLEYLRKVLLDGIPGTAMPSWQGQISESDRQAVASFVRSLFQRDDR